MCVCFHFVFSHLLSYCCCCCCCRRSKINRRSKRDLHKHPFHRNVKVVSACLSFNRFLGVWTRNIHLCLRNAKLTTFVLLLIFFHFVCCFFCFFSLVYREKHHRQRNNTPTKMCDIKKTFQTNKDNSNHPLWSLRCHVRISFFFQQVD